MSSLTSVKLGSLGEVITGTTPPARHPDWFAPEGTPFVTPSDVIDGQRSVSAARFLSPTGTLALSKRIVPPGSICFVSIGSTIGKMCSITTPSLTNQQINTLVVDRLRGHPTYIYYALAQRSSHLKAIAGGSATPILNKTAFSAVEIEVLPVEDQQGVGKLLDSLDDKIESNRRLRDLLRMVGSARFDAALAGAASRTLPLGEVTVSIARGVAPQYADDDPSAPLVLNQRCVRNGWVTTSQARRMVARDVSPSKRVSDGDILVNSTGTGTLGRVGRWHKGSIFVDGHLSVVKADSAIVHPTVLAYAIFGREADIEGMATGSTGQTELSPSRLAALMVKLPDRTLSAELESVLAPIEERIDSLRAEEVRLLTLRDTFVPGLISGRIRIPKVNEVLA